MSRAAIAVVLSLVTTAFAQNPLDTKLIKISPQWAQQGFDPLHPKNAPTVLDGLDRLGRVVSDNELLHERITTRAGARDDRMTHCVHKPSLHPKIFVALAPRCTGFVSTSVAIR